MDSYFDNEEFSYSIPEPTLIEDHISSLKTEIKEEPFDFMNFDFSKVYQLMEENAITTPPPKNIQTEEATRVLLENEKIELFIKPARKTADHYLDYLPNSLYCAPYKYDLKFLVPSTMSHTHELSFKLVDGETGEEIQSDKGALQLEKITRSHLKSGQTQVQVRVCFTLCSFHNHKRAFTLGLYAKSYLDDSYFAAFMSTPFHTYARKSKEMDAWAVKPIKKERLEVQIPTVKKPSSTEISKLIDICEKTPTKAFSDLDSLLLL
eukprot:gene9621-1825_t